MKNYLLPFILLLTVCLSLTSCEKPMSIDDIDDDDETLVSLTFNVTQFEQIPFDDVVSESRAANSAQQICNRINFALFSEGTKQKSINQVLNDNDFGSIKTSVSPGKYTVVILAHSGSGNATFSTPEEVKFQNNKVTDTFYYYGQIDTNEANSYDIKLKRAVAMFRLITDNVPENVKEMSFYYTGGSSTFNAATGFGSVNSRQTETREVTAEMIGKPGEFDVYTFPHSNSGELKMTVTAKDDASNTVAEKVFEKVPVTINQITRYEGDFFNAGGQSGAATFSLTSDDEWTQQTYQY